MQASEETIPSGPSVARLTLVDSLRGLAVLGIVLINIGFYAWPKARQWYSFQPEFALDIDLWADLIVRILVKGKFYIIFSFLFGLGMAMQRERFQFKSGSFSWFFLKRMFWLMAIGAFHGFAIWHGDILLIYGSVGVLLLLFQGLKTRGLLVAAVLILSAHLAYVYLPFVIKDFPTRNDPVVIAKELEAQTSAAEGAKANYDQVLKIYTEEDWLGVAKRRAGEYTNFLSAVSYWAAELLAAFLFGAMAWHTRIFQEPQARLKAIKTAALIGFTLGLPLNIWVYATLFYHPIGFDLSLAFFLAGPAKFIMAMGYITGFIWLWQTGRARSLWERLIPVGKMALSNYVLQSVVFTLIFNGYGLGLMGQVGETTAIAMATAFFLVQVLWSHWWLKRYRFGPLEWLWRSITYLRLQPMRR